MLCELFRLTPAEARLAGLLAEGYVLKEAADHLGVTIATVRSQRKQGFQKTGASRQSELVRLVLRLIIVLPA